MERKYRVLVAEDEPLILAGLKFFVEQWGRTEWMEEAYNGKDALEKCLANHPDIIISDIRMPGMDGIEMLEAIRQAGLKTRLVFYSGYAEFDYAREAIRLGAFDYLLKPIQQEKLCEVLDKAAAEIISEEEKYTSIREKKNQMEAICEVLWIGNTINFEEFEKNAGMEFPEKKFQILALQSMETGNTDWTVSDKIYGICENVRYCRIRLGKNKVILLLNLSKELDNQRALHIAETIFSIKLRGGSSSCADRKEKVSTLMEEAEAAFATAELLERNHIISYYKPAKENFAFYKKRMLESIVEKDTKRVGAVLEHFWSKLQNEEIMLTQMIDLYNEILALLSEKNKYYEQYEKADVSYLREMIHKKSEFYELFLNLFEEDEMEFRDTEMTVHQAIRDIEQNYREEITLNSLGDKYHISISYLSAMIKKETGHTFTELITNLRIEKAKELLAKDNIAVSEVTELVGYNDYFYFTKLFKKCVGITPSKYRKMLENMEQDKEKTS